MFFFWTLTSEWSIAFLVVLKSNVVCIIAVYLQFQWCWHFWIWFISRRFSRLQRGLPFLWQLLCSRLIMLTDSTILKFFYVNYILPFWLVYILDFTYVFIIQIRLTRNYRSTGCIVEAASSLIKHNVKRCQLKNVLTENSYGSKVH